MIQETIEKLLREKGLGSALGPITPVPGGYLHRMFRVDTQTGTYAVKHLNPKIMKRPEAMRNFRTAESYERLLERAGIPIVPALELDGSKMQVCDGEYFYLFHWQNGQATDWYHISPAQCRMAGSIQGRIHALAPRRIENIEAEACRIDWNRYIEEAERQNPVIGALLRENEALLNYAQDAVNRARSALPGIACIVDEDMDPKNVLWDEGRPYVIDLECLGRGSPVSSALQLSLQWAGVTTCDLDFDRLKAFFDGYHEAYDNGFRAYGRVFGLAYTWIEWLEYNITRALGACADEAEREMGIAEVKNTVARIRYLREKEDQIIDHFNTWFV